MENELSPCKESRGLNTGEETVFHFSFFISLADLGGQIDFGSGIRDDLR